MGLGFRESIGFPKTKGTFFGGSHNIDCSS